MTTISTSSPLLYHSISLYFAIFTIFCLLLPTCYFTITLLYNYPFQLKLPEKIHNECQENLDDQYSWCPAPFVTIGRRMMNVTAWGYSGMWIAADSKSEHQDF